MACKCDVGLSNTGTACTPLQAVARQYVLTPKFKADGTSKILDAYLSGIEVVITLEIMKIEKCNDCVC